MSWQPARYALPDFAELAEKARRSSPETARRSGADAGAVLGAGYEPLGLNDICAQRKLRLSELAAHAEAQRRTARELLSNHDRSLPDDDLAGLVAAREEARHTVAQLSARSSVRPGDGYASEVAIKGGFGRRLRKVGPPFLLLIALLAVDIPIYYQTLLDLGISGLMTAALGVAAVLVFGFGPHLYGRKFREWQEEGTAPRSAREFSLRDWISRPSMMIVLPVLWLVTITAVTWARLQTLVSLAQPVPGDPASVVGPAIVTIGAVPMLILLLTLVIFTGIIAMETGRRMGNPNDRLLKDARAQVRELEERLSAARQRVGEAAQYRNRLTEISDPQKPYEHELIEQIHRGYDLVESSYVTAHLEEFGPVSPDVAARAGDILADHRKAHH
ncbi:hypothetical protein Acor_80810 [Acrocarpospora corrugata]|uniref:Uncharacterized protein n=1 Tax=Acrocarpospora corrugata TaxID=35763 RepID=A0A5M3WD62_9ACTN|nr:hypothetical protein [Acrocarpospora corrugata]GES06012.1 hypothetical protein Acor_80810 [Acrocarpospora corrugata]